MLDHRFQFRLLAAAVGATLVFSACGSDDDAGGGSIADWCAFAAEAEAVDAVFDTLGDDPSTVEAGFKTVKELAERLPKVAPPGAAADAQKLSDGTLRIVKVFEDADYNILDADLSVLDDQALQDELDTAGANLDTFTQTECGRAFGAEDSSSDDGSSDDPTPADDDGDDDSGFDPSAGTLRDQLVTQFESIGLTSAEANCIADNLDFNDPAVQSGDVGAMLDVFGTCNISLDRLSELGGG